MNYALEVLGGKVTSRDTNVWMRDRSRCVNSEVQHSADNAEGGLGGRGGLAVHRCMSEV